MPRPVPDLFTFLRNRKFQQAHLIKSEQVVIRPEPSTDFKQCLCGLVPFLFQNRLREPQGVALYASVLFLFLDDVLIYGGQLLLERGYDQALPTIMFGSGCQVFCGFLCIGIGGLFAFGVAPCDSV